MGVTITLGHLPAQPRIACVRAHVACLRFSTPLHPKTISGHWSRFVSVHLIFKERDIRFVLLQPLAVGLKIQTKLYYRQQIKLYYLQVLRQ